MSAPRKPYYGQDPLYNYDKKHNGIRSPAEKINGKKYHDDWLQNLFISSSMAGYWSSPQNSI